MAAWDCISFQCRSVNRLRYPLMVLSVISALHTSQNYAPTVARPSRSPMPGTHCCFSSVPITRHRISPTGKISLNEDNKAISEQIRPAFEKIRRWVKKHWHKTEQFASYVGPEAHALLSANEAEWRSCLHAAKGHVVLV